MKFGGFLFILIFFLSGSQNSFPQTFQKEQLIDIPGSNYDFDVITSQDYLSPETFITWINRKDSTYAIYLKKLSPEKSNDILIYSDKQVKSNPQITFTYSQSLGHGIKITWDNFNGSYYQIAGRNYYLNDTLTGIIVIKDSLPEPPQTVLNESRIAWIENGNLYAAKFDEELSEITLLDSSSCNSPCLAPGLPRHLTTLLYEKIINNVRKIFIAEYDEFQTPAWQIRLYEEQESKNPSFGNYGGISYELVENGISKIKYSAYLNTPLNLTSNISCNFKNPNVFSYPIPTGSSDDNTPFFVAFDTDSLPSNREIFIKTFYYGIYDSLFNISEMEGDDMEPVTTIVSENDTAYASVIWIHQNGTESQIWIAKNIFKPIITSINENKTVPVKFILYQNYPNPFNPRTTIKYSIPPLETLHATSQQMQLKIYDILGKEIVTLVNKNQSPGNYEVTFNAVGLPSGIYFYKLKVGNFTQVKKMILMK